MTCGVLRGAPKGRQVGSLPLGRRPCPGRGWRGSALALSGSQRPRGRGGAPARPPGPRARVRAAHSSPRGQARAPPRGGRPAGRALVPGPPSAPRLSDHRPAPRSAEPPRGALGDRGGSLRGPGRAATSKALGLGEGGASGVAWPEPRGTAPGRGHRASARDVPARVSAAKPAPPTPASP